jgi:hypothetical protein
MKLEPRGRLLTEAVHAAAMELAKEASTPRYPAPQPARKPNPEDIRALAARTPITPETNTDELWSAAAISPEGNRHWGLGRTPSEASACAWAYSHWTDGSCSINIETLLNIPDGWNFELYPPPEKQPQMLAISADAIFKLLRRSIPDVTIEESRADNRGEPPLFGGQRHLTKAPGGRRLSSPKHADNEARGA